MQVLVLCWLVLVYKDCEDCEDCKNSKVCSLAMLRRYLTKVAALIDWHKIEFLVPEWCTKPTARYSVD